MDAATRRLVVERAGNRCEYCGIHQDSDPVFRFHVEHIIPRQHGGLDDLNNLALACGHCNRFKGPNLAALDPESGELVPLYDPRRQLWSEHFDVVGGIVSGLSPTGRATAALLQMNRPRRVQIRN